MENLEILVTDWKTDRARMSAIRGRVFVQEQAVPVEIELDDADESATHFLAVLAGTDLGTGRLLPDGHIGRVAVLAEHRGKGVGTALMRAMIQLASLRGFDHLELSSQTHALAFYQGLGFEPVGETFLEAGIPHQNMCLNLSKA